MQVDGTLVTFPAACSPLDYYKTAVTPLRTYVVNIQL